jgi:hypothetical protein
MATQIPTVDDLQKMFKELNSSIIEVKKEISEMNAQKATIGYWSTKKVCEDTGVPSSTLHSWKNKGWLKKGDDYRQVGKKYMWNVNSIKKLIESDRIEENDDDLSTPLAS